MTLASTVAEVIVTGPHLALTIARGHMSTFHTTEYADVDDLPGEGNDSESQEMWEGLGWDDSIAACFDAGTSARTTEYPNPRGILIIAGNSFEE